MPSNDPAGTDEDSGSGSSVNATQTQVPFDHLQAACQAFSGELKRGGSPDIPSYLVKVAGDDQATLLRNLLEYEVLKRRERGESPRVEDYFDQLPDHTAVVRQVFLETSSIYIAGDQLPDTEEFPKDRLLAPRLGDFRLVRQLGRGGMGAVYEAVHVARGHRVALKTLPTVDPDALHRFKREFRLVSEMTHPNLCGLHTLENDGAQYFITMDLISGVDFRSWVRPVNTLDEQRLRAALPQLVAAVMGLHAQGVVHRDLKPQNVLVTQDGHLVVLDFGLVADLAGATGSLADIAGTPPYMAPEQTTGAAVGPPVDWYALGVMLYDALADGLPFQSADMLELFRQKQERDAPPLPDNVPSDLAELCLKLLARSPTDRPDPLAIAGAVQTTISMSTPRSGNPDELVGRESQLAALTDYKNVMDQSGAPITVFISGRSGEGKTSLADRFLAQFRERSAVVLSGRCYDRESVPFKALDTLIDALTDYLRVLPVDAVLRLLPDDIGILSQLFPELKRCEEVSNQASSFIEQLDQQQIRSRAFGALRLLLHRIAQSKTLIIFIDDLQWGDEDSARAMFEVLRPPDAPSVLFLGSFRSDEQDNSPFLKEWEELQRVNAAEIEGQKVEVGPLSLEESTALVVNQLGIDNAAIRRRAVQFHAQTGGNPFLLVELVGCFNPESDSFHATDIYGVLDEKLVRLPEDAKPLLHAVAVSGQSLDPAEAFGAAGLERSPDDTLIAMQNSRLLRKVGNKLDTYHDRIRYAVVDRLESSLLQELHARLARVIEEKAGGLTNAEIDALVTKGERMEPKILSRVYDLAYHWNEAGDARRALAYAMAAAVQARGQFSLDVAAEQYALAERNATGSPRIVRFRIARGRGEALLLVGHYEEAGSELDRALPLAELPYDTADVIGLKGVLARQLGKIAESIGNLEEAISRLGVHVPRTPVGVCWGITKEVAIQVVHSLLPRRLHQRSCDQVEVLRNALLGQIEWSYWENDIPHLLWASLVGLNRAERVPQSPSLSLQYVVHANDMSLLGWLSRAEGYYERARKLSEQWDDLWGAALASSHYAVGTLASTRYTEGIDAARKGMDMFSQIGDVGEVHLAQQTLITNLYRMGDLHSAAKEAQDLLRSCVRHEDNYIGPLALSIFAQSCLGQVPFDELVGSVRVAPGNRLGQTMLFMAEGQWHTAHKRTDKALSMFEQAWDVCRANLYLTPYNMSVVSDLASALRRHAETLEAEHSDSGTVRLRWQRMARAANRLSWFLPPERPHALRELSLAYAHRGRLKNALKLVTKSCQIAEQQHSQYQHAQSLLVKGQFEKKLGNATADEIRVAQSKIDEIEGAVRDFGQFTQSGPQRDVESP